MLYIFSVIRIAIIKEETRTAMSQWIIKSYLQEEGENEKKNCSSSSERGDDLYDGSRKPGQRGTGRRR